MTDINYRYSEGLAAGREGGVLGALAALLNRFANRVVLFRYGEFIFVTYGLMGGLGAFAGLLWMGVILVGQGLPRADFALLALSGSLGILLSSRIGALVLDYRQLLRRPMGTLRSVAFVSWGGIAALPLMLFAFGRVAGFPVLLLFDACARAGPLGHAIGRLGCISYGCCYGRRTRSPLAVSYHDPQAKAVRVAGLRGVPLHPAPLYEAGWDLAIFAVLNTLSFLGAPQGVPSTVYILLYGLGRFGIEFLRDNEGRMLWGPLAVNHLLSLGLAAFGAIFLPVVLIFQADSPAISLGPALGDMLPLLPLLALSGLILFLGFAIHRGRVGEW